MTMQKDFRIALVASLVWTLFAAFQTLGKSRWDAEWWIAALIFGNVGIWVVTWGLRFIEREPTQNQ